MKNKLSPALFSLFLGILIISCAGIPVAPAVIETAPPLNPALVEEIPERPERPMIPEYIMGTGIIPPTDMAVFLINANPLLDTDYAEELAVIYTEEAEKEGINHDVAFAQMCLETGYLRFGNLVTPEMYNFAGLGATGITKADGEPERGLHFPDPRTGIRAQIQHLKAYASDMPLNQELVNPRYFYVRLGSSPSIMGLSGTWASDPNYAEKIKNILEGLYYLSFGY